MKWKIKNGLWWENARKWNTKASLTVEGALVMSILLLILMGCLQKTIIMYQQVRERTQITWLELGDMDQVFRVISLGRDIIE